MKFRADVYSCTDHEHANCLVVKNLLEKAGNTVDFCLKNPTSSPSEDSPTCVLFTCRTCASLDSSLSIISKLSANRQVVVGLFDFDEDTADTFMSKGARDVFPARTISTKMFLRYLIPYEENDNVQQHALSVLDKLPINLIMTDQKGKIVFTNKGANELLAHQNGIEKSEQGYLIFNDPMNNTALYQKIRAVTETSTEDNSLRTVIGEDQLVSIIVPLIDSRGVSGAAVFLRNENENSQINGAVLKALYDLSAAESDLVIALSSGLTVNEIADRKKLSLHTVRTQIKNIYSKTGFKRQSDLIKAVLTGPAMIRMQN
jgi:DNA-binding CsgD family transcriptional regulator